MSCTTVPESPSSLESPECGRSAAEATSQTLKRSSAWIQNIMGIKGVAYATSLAAIFSLAILALFMKQKVAEVRLMSMRNFGIILISALITWKVASALKKVFATYNVWLNMIAFVCIFAVFWTIALVVELAIKMWKGYLKV